jgi:hypothetical protein
MEQLLFARSVQFRLCTSAERPFLCRKIFSRRNSYVRLLVGSGQSGSFWKQYPVMELRSP